MVRAKPSPQDPRTLAQAYQRWDYQDYAAWWQTLTPVQKQQWETDARRQKITGFNYWMRSKLNTLPDLAARWRLDILASGSTPDSSKNSNNLTVVGATPCDTLLGRGLLFDGVDDYLYHPNMPDDTIPHGNTPFSITGFIKFNALGKRQFLITWGTYGAAHQVPIFEMTGTNWWSFHNWDQGQAKSATPAPNLTDWFAFGASYDLSNHRLYVKGECKATTPYNQADIGQTLLRVGTYGPTSLNVDAYLDNIVIHNRVLTPEDFKRHSERRYP